jgi:hypothetical protein
MHQLAHNGRSGRRVQRIRLAFQPFRNADHNVIFGVADGRLDRSGSTSGREPLKLSDERRGAFFRCHGSSSGHLPMHRPDVIRHAADGQKAF